MTRPGFRLLTTILATALATVSVSAQESAKKSGASGGKYEEHYELLPPEEPDSAGGAAPASGNLDPEGDAPAPPRPTAGHKSTVPALPARRARAAAPPPPLPEPEVEPAPAAATPPPRQEARPEPRPRAERPAAQPVEEDSERKRPAASAAAASEGDDVADVSFFYEALEGEGTWKDHARYGEVFLPQVEAGWRPYTLGRWAYGDDLGWTWVSEEPFGWATFHYGRWAFEQGTGWMWIPGTQWAPAWVVWRQGEDAIGWAPLPPDAQFSQSGLKMDAASIEGERFERAWVFVRPRYFAMPGMRRFVRPERWNADLVHATAPRVGYQRDGGRVANRGIAPEDVERLGERPVTRVNITTVDDPRAKRLDRFEASRAMSQLRLYRPSRKRTQEIARKGQRRKEERDVRSSQSGGEGTVAGTERKPAAQKKTVKFAPQPVRERTETEGGVTESWLPPEKPGAEKASKPKETATKDTAAKETAAKDDAGNTAASGSKSPAAAASEPAGRERDYGPSASKPRPAAEPRRAERSESYSTPSADDLGEEEPSKPQRGTATGSVPAQKRRWDGSGSSGAPTVVPGASGPGTQ